MTASEVQPDLISPDPPLCEVRLEADSSRKAFYIVSVSHAPGGIGYLISRSAGASGTKGQSEIYWRSGLKLALEKYSLLVNAKLHKKTGRLYKVSLERENEKQNSSRKD